MQAKKKFGLLGYPLGHSLSDYIHKRIFELCEIEDECEYALYEINPDSLKDGEGTIAQIRELSGFNVTIPYKTEIIPYLTRLDKSADVYGAVNCVKVDNRGVTPELVGYNTDGYGFLKALQKLGSPFKQDMKVLLLGCGGTARMMAFEAAKAGADLTIAIRRDKTEEKAAAKLSGDIAKTLGGINEEPQKSPATPTTLGQTATIGQATKVRITYAESLNLVNEYELLLNATPCGMHPNVNEIPLNSSLLKKVKFLFDAIYNPYPTKLISEAEKHGVKCLDGMVMLVEQAVAAERIWNDIEIDDKEIAKIIQECREKLY